MNRIERWLENIFHTKDEEISCSECFDSVSHYVDLELSNQDPQAKLPQVWEHLRQCAACREEYETLRDLQRMENEGNPPSISDLRNSIK